MDAERIREFIHLPVTWFGNEIVIALGIALGRDMAAARRLAIDLWRWATGRATAKELGLQFQLTMTQKPSV